MDNKPNMAKCFLYIAQANKERGACKIGITDDLDRHLKEYNSETGRSADNLWEYLFTCETDNAKQIEDDIKKNLGRLRQKKRKEKKSIFIMMNCSKIILLLSKRINFSLKKFLLRKKSLKSK